jgi:hypothetical protein
LRKALEEVLHRNRQWFLVAASLAVALFAVLIVFLFVRPIEAAEHLTIVAVGAGGSAFALVRWMHHLWRDKVLLEVLITSATYLGPDDVRGLILILRERYLASQARSRRGAEATGATGATPANT